MTLAIVPQSPSVLAGLTAPPEGPMEFTQVFDFSVSASYSVDFTFLQLQKLFSFVKCVFVDNSANAQPIEILTNISAQPIICPGYAQGYFPITPVAPDRFTISSSGSVKVTIIFYNIAFPAAVWSVNSSSGTVTPEPIAPSGVTTLTSRSQTTPASAASTQLMAANTSRSYMLFQAPEAGTAGIWVNFLGGTASVAGADCFFMAPGTIYETTSPKVNQGRITYYTADTSKELPAIEGSN